MDDPNKRAVVNANRRVANMTSSQIESKRSIDRANQRYCRAKRKTQLGQLQSQVEELTRELDDARRQLREYREREETWDFAGNNANLLDPTWDLPSTSSLNHRNQFQGHPSPGPPSRPLPWTGHFILDYDSPFTALHAAEWKAIPPLTDATTQLDQVILTTTQTLRSRGFRAAHKESPFPSISSLLNPAGQDKSGSCSISTAAAAQVGRSPVASLLARVGFMYFLSHLLRWYICRTKESYDQLPSCIRPTLLQRTVPHPAWIDVIVWPEVRDAIIQHMDWSRFYEFRAVVSKSLCVGWPHMDTRAVFESGDGKNYKLSSVFEQHLRDGSNWTVGADAAEAFPFLKPVCRESP
ncbi:hypothetical protein BKA56DRAFT_693124 [Ilyonectria sp. MPI-CAGE-AT-0026]|nr:hypothetical protein BKA56DRAFT_693124 [Ilyonectria sp. MPI-CAGE-AT-0026]